MKVSANLFYVRNDGRLFVQLKKNMFVEHPDLEIFFEITKVNFPKMTVYGTCVGVTSTGIILDDWSIEKTNAKVFDFANEGDDD